MMELVAGLIMALAALAYVLEPLARPSRPDPRGTTGEELVNQMRAGLLSTCPACSTQSTPGAAFCAKCGEALLDKPDMG